MLFSEVRVRKWASLSDAPGEKEIGRSSRPKMLGPQSDNSGADLMGRHAEESIQADPKTVYFSKDLCAKALTWSPGELEQGGFFGSCP